VKKLGVWPKDLGSQPGVHSEFLSRERERGKGRKRERERGRKFSKIKCFFQNGAEGFIKAKSYY
jgi:hypothetical protein